MDIGLLNTGCIQNLPHMLHLEDKDWSSEASRRSGFAAIMASLIAVYQGMDTAQAAFCSVSEPEPKICADPSSFNISPEAVGPVCEQLSYEPCYPLDPCETGMTDPLCTACGIFEQGKAFMILDTSRETVLNVHEVLSHGDNADEPLIVSSVEILDHKQELGFEPSPEHPSLDFKDYPKEPMRRPQQSGLPLIRDLVGSEGGVFEKMVGDEQQVLEQVNAPNLRELPQVAARGTADVEVSEGKSKEFTFDTVLASNETVLKLLPETALSTVPAEPGTKQVKAVVEPVIRAAVSKLGTVEIQLDPPSLGKVTVLLSSRGDRVTVKFITSSQEATQILFDSKSTLDFALSQRGLSLSGFLVDQNGTGQQYRGNQDFNHRLRQNQRPKKAALSPESSHLAACSASLGQALIDYRA